MRARRLESRASGLPPTEAAYGSEVADLLDRYAPDVFFEDDAFASLPGRLPRAAGTAPAPTRSRGHGGLDPDGPAGDGLHPRGRLPPPRSSPASTAAASAPVNLYLQYWLYYPESLTHGLGRRRRLSP